MWKLKIAEGGNPWLRTTNNYVGREVWEFDPNLGSPEDRAEIDKFRDYFSKHRLEQKHSADLIMRYQLSKENQGISILPQVKVQDNEDITEDSVATTLRRALSFYSTLQTHDGHWAGDYGGPMFLMPGMWHFFLSYSPVGAWRKSFNCNNVELQNSDGGWGLHIQSHSTMFGSVLSYVTLRLLGEGANDGEGAMEKGRKWILDHGSATAITSWGEMWLSVLGAFDWSGNNPLPPEIWLLPYILPIHPGRMWCHCRMVYLPMCYLYGKRFVGPITPTVLSLRKELFTVPYHEVDWDEARNECAKILNMLCCWVEDPNSEAFKLHLPRIDDYMWVAEDGMKIKGYNGSQSWDTSFAVQAIIATGLGEEYGSTLRKAHSFINNTQVEPLLGHLSRVKDDCPGNLDFWYRHISKGAWPFSTADHGCPISDCTAEGLKAALVLSKLPSEIVGDPLDAKSFYDAVNVLLSLQGLGMKNDTVGTRDVLQNSGGGFATYELSRSYPWLEIINPAETFGDIVIDYPYVECSSAAFKKLYPGHRKEEVERCIAKAAAFIEKIQEADGSCLLHLWHLIWGAWLASCRKELR
ncbi:hypothetical protein RND71_028071 [Anisodus tanguticus]|uniref:Squalene cyclase N-terminal domain-containing protein n=1 Tax=Anisodus tanguticus TaxID=243964 RepID=A0AAE1V194_9SOLA|nr:hypothetical protein RND71_028071 [Anisodus tanguticus]